MRRGGVPKIVADEDGAGSSANATGSNFQSMAPTDIAQAARTGMGGQNAASNNFFADAQGNPYNTGGPGGASGPNGAAGSAAHLGDDLQAQASRVGTSARGGTKASARGRGAGGQGA